MRNELRHRRKKYNKVASYPYFLKDVERILHLLKSMSSTVFVKFKLRTYKDTGNYGCNATAEVCISLYQCLRRVIKLTLRGHSGKKVETFKKIFLKPLDIFSMGYNQIAGKEFEIILRGEYTSIPYEFFPALLFPGL